MSYEYKGEKLFSASIQFYSACDELKNTFRLNFKLDEDIDEGALRVAADKCQKRFPYLMVKVKSTLKEMELVPNPEPIPIIKGDGLVSIGSAETNHHLVALSYSENNLYFSAFHGLLDGKGVMMFMRTLMHYYTVEKYHENPSGEGVFLVEDEIDSEEYTDPYTVANLEKSEDFISSNSEKPDYFKISSDKRVTPGGQYNFYLKVKQDSLIKYCKENDASPAVLFSLLICRGIKKLNPETSKTISCGLANDLRPALGTPKSHYSTVGVIPLDFDERIQKLDFEMQDTAFRGKILLQNDREHLKAGLRSGKKFYEFVAKIPLLVLKKAFLKKIVRMNLGIYTFTLSYVGRASFGDCEKHIKEIYSDADAKHTGIFVEVNSIGDYFFLNFVQEWKERLYFDEFCNQMKGLGLEYEVLREGEFKIPDVSL